jgi:hypothetical protein
MQCPFGRARRRAGPTSPRDAPTEHGVGSGEEQGRVVAESQRGGAGGDPEGGGTAWPPEIRGRGRRALCSGDERAGRQRQSQTRRVKEEGRWRREAVEKATGRPGSGGGVRVRAASPGGVLVGLWGGGRVRSENASEGFVAKSICI